MSEVANTQPAVATSETKTTEPKVDPKLASLPDVVKDEITGKMIPNPAKHPHLAPKHAVDAVKTAGNTSDPVKDAAKEVMRKFKVKVDGQEMEVDEQTLIKGFAHQKKASKVLQEGVNARKQAEEFITMMKNPEKFYEVAAKLGHDPRILAEKYLASKLEEEILDPKEKELREAKRKLTHYEELEKQKAESITKQRDEALKAKYAQEYNDQFVDALNKTGLPPTKHMVAEMAKYISRATELKFEMSAAEAAQLVREDLQKAQQRLISEADGETLIKLLGEETANKIRKYDTSKLKSPEQHLKTPAHSEQTFIDKRTRNVNGKRMTSKEWREFNRK